MNYSNMLINIIALGLRVSKKSNIYPSPQFYALHFKINVAVLHRPIGPKGPVNWISLKSVYFTRKVWTVLDRKSVV